MDKSFLICLLLFALLQAVYAPPVKENKDKEQEENELGGLEDYMEYHRYLREVVNALESDAEFKQKIEKATEEDIKSGKIAEELEFVSHHVRTRLDELKRIELERLKELMKRKRQIEMEQEHDKESSHGHLDHANPHTFEIEDLKKLIKKTTEDLAVADQKRKEEFKEYELQKEYEWQKKLNETSAAEEREKLEKEHKEQLEKHKKHERLHEPGHKAQLEEVWEEQDQMQQDFDPKTFFMLHDVDGNGLWDQDEVKALFIKELDKMYSAGAPEDDMRERIEEMERMRETVFKEVDTNNDGFIDYEEFLAQTKRNDFQQDHGWQGLDEQRPYTDEELAEYIRQHQANQMGYGHPPSYYNNPNIHPQQYNGPVPGQGYPPPVPPGYEHAAFPPPGQQGFQQGQVPPQAYHQGQQYHGGQNQPPQGQYHDLNTNEIYPQGNAAYHQPIQYQQQPPKPGYHPQQHPPPHPGQFQNQQQPPQQQNQYQPPPQQPNQYQPPPQQQQNQPPQQVNQPPVQQNQPPQQVNQPPAQQNQPPQQVNQPPAQQNQPPQQANQPPAQQNQPQQMNQPPIQQNQPPQQMNQPPQGQQQGYQNQVNSPNGHQAQYQSNGAPPQVNRV